MRDYNRHEHVTVFGSVWQGVAECYSVLQRVAMDKSTEYCSKEC